MCKEMKSSHDTAASYTIYLMRSSYSGSALYKFASTCVLHRLFSPRHISYRDCVKLRLIYTSCCVVSPIGNVCVMASIRELSKRMRIRRQRERCVDRAQQETLSPLLTPVSLSLPSDPLINSVLLCVFLTVSHEVKRCRVIFDLSVDEMTHKICI